MYVKFNKFNDVSHRNKIKITYTLSIIMLEDSVPFVMSVKFTNII